MTSFYPDRHHPVFFLIDALAERGVQAEFAKDERTDGCWGFILPNGKACVWLIDNRHPHEAKHEDPAAERLLARGVLVMCAQEPDAVRIGARWLPLAVTPSFHWKQLAKTHDAAFVGYVRDHERATALTEIAARFSLALGEGVFGEDAVDLYAHAKVGVNVVTQAGRPTAYDSWNMRAPEIMATGTPLVTPAQPYLEALGITVGIHCLTYADLTELATCVNALVENEPLRLQIGEAGARLVQERHLYTHRAAQVLEWVK